MSVLSGVPSSSKQAASSTASPPVTEYIWKVKKPSSKQQWRLPPKKRKRLQQNPNMKCADGLDVNSLLRSLMDEVSKQRTVSDLLVEKVEALGESNYQNQLILSGIQSHLNGISQQLRNLGACDSKAGSTSMAKANNSRTSGVEHKFSGDSSSSDPDQVAYRLTRKRPHYSTDLSTELDQSSEEVQWSSSSLSCTHKSPSGQSHSSTQNHVRPCYSFPSLNLSSVSSSSESEPDNNDDEDYTVKPKKLTAKRQKLKTATNVSSVQLESSGYSSSIPKNTESSERTSELKVSLPQKPPVAAPIVSSDNVLPSSVIDKSKLWSVEAVLKEYSGLQPRNFSRKLAKLAIFGPEVMKKCSPLGRGKYPALPQAELYMLKQILLDSFPEYWTDLNQFEYMWKTEVLQYLAGQCCSLRGSTAVRTVKKNSEEIQEE